MKKLITSLLFVLTLSACSDFAATMDTLQGWNIHKRNAGHFARSKARQEAIQQARTPEDRAKLLPSKADMNEQLKNKAPLPMISGKDLGLADGEHTIPHSNGRYAKTVIRNGIMDNYFDVYESNGKLQSHTPLVKGIAQGWADGYSLDGIHSRVFYQDGKPTRWQRYTPDGQLIDEDTIK